MRCLSCHRFSWKVICDECSDRLLISSPSKRRVANLEVVSLFKYKNIEQFLLTKHTPIGYRVYKYLSKRFVRPFIYSYMDATQEGVRVIAIDESVSSGYSHTALLAHYAKNTYIKVCHAKLLAKNRVNYAGKSLHFRLNNPRDFRYTGEKNIDVILIDDIITTGVTLQEAQIELRKHGVNVLFALTIADARD